MIKLVALDLDGTLLTPEKTISEASKDMIRKAKQAGVKVVLCSGRPLLGIKRYLEELDLLGDGDYSITYNGGLVQRNSTSEVLSQKVLTYKQIKELYALSQKLQVPMNMLDLQCVYEPAYPTGHESLYHTLMSASLPFVERSIDSFDPDHVFNKVVICTEPEYLDDAIARIPTEYYERYSMMKSRPLLFEIMHPEVDKGNGIQTLCELLGYKPEEVMAVGDEENDLAMLKFAGVSVAMENGREDIKAKVDFVTRTNGEDGVAYAMQKYLFPEV